jgi:hypothetical protein
MWLVARKAEPIDPLAAMDIASQARKTGLLIEGRTHVFFMQARTWCLFQLR